MKSQEIPIVFSVNEGYAKYVSVSIQSIVNCVNFNFEYKIYVLYTDLEENTIQTLQSLGIGNVQVIFIGVSKEWECISKYFVMCNDAAERAPCGHISKETYFHMFITKYLPDHELVIYSDCDVIFLEDPAILLSGIRENKDSAMVYGVINFSSIGTKKYIEDKLGVSPDQYINAGIFVLNVQRAIKEQLIKKYEALLPRMSEFVMMDQDIINVALSAISDGIRLLDARWNFQWHPLDKSLLNLCSSIKNDFICACSAPFAIHYTSATKPWKKPYKPFAELFWKIAQNSPYYSDIKADIEDCGPTILLSKREIKGSLKVSVIMPVYNEEKLLTRCLDSLCNQSLTNIEIICVDDGSTDGSVGVMKEYMKLDSRIQVICQKNSGAGEARNTGIHYASGEYLYFIDADDYLVEDTLESIVSCADSAKADVVIFDAFHTDENEKISYPITYILPRYSTKDVFAPKEACDYLFLLTGCCVWNKLYRTEYIRKNGMLFQQLKGADDVFFSMLSLAFAERIALCKKRLIYHTINKSDSQMTMLERYPLNQGKALLSVKQVLIEYGLYELLEQSFVNRAAQNSIKNLSRINTYSIFLAIYREYQRSLFQKLGINNKSKDFFFRKELYSDIRFILENECNESVFDERKKFLSISKRKERS